MVAWVIDGWQMWTFTITHLSLLSICLRRDASRRHNCTKVFLTRNLLAIFSQNTRAGCFILSLGTNNHRVLVTKCFFASSFFRQPNAMTVGCDDGVSSFGFWKNAVALVVGLVGTRLSYSWAGRLAFGLPWFNSTRRVSFVWSVLHNLMTRKISHQAINYRCYQGITKNVRIQKLHTDILLFNG